MKHDESRLCFHCLTKTCSRQVPLRKDPFDEYRLPIHKIVHLAYLWIKEDSSKSIRGTTKHSRQAAADFLTDFRQLITDSLDPEDHIIGSPGTTVEIDETKMGKRKNHRGHRVEGVWVLGGVERTTQRKVFALPVPDRKAATIQWIIQEHVKPGSIIYTDGWKGYNCLNTMKEYAHYVVNHAKHFKDLETGVHTNTIEGIWYATKSKIPIRKRTSKFTSGTFGSLSRDRRMRLDFGTHSSKH